MPPLLALPSALCWGPSAAAAIGEAEGTARDSKMAEAPETGELRLLQPLPFLVCICAAAAAAAARSFLRWN